MANFKNISISDVAANIDNLTIVDIRDPSSFAAGHIPGAMPLSNDNFADFITNTDKASPIVVVCYHGMSSQQAAQTIAAQGFSNVSSMDGGFETWKLSQKVESDL